MYSERHRSKCIDILISAPHALSRKFPLATQMTSFFVSVLNLVRIPSVDLYRPPPGVGHRASPRFRSFSGPRLHHDLICQVCSQQLTFSRSVLAVFLLPADVRLVSTFLNVVRTEYMDGKEQAVLHPVSSAPPCAVPSTCSLLELSRTGILASCCSMSSPPKHPPVRGSRCYRYTPGSCMPGGMQNNTRVLFRESRCSALSRQWHLGDTSG